MLEDLPVVKLMDGSLVMVPYLSVDANDDISITGIPLFYSYDGTPYHFQGTGLDRLQTAVDVSSVFIKNAVAVTLVRA